MHKAYRLGSQLLTKSFGSLRIRHLIPNVPTKYYSVEKESMLNTTEIEYTAENWNMIKQYNRMSYHELLAEYQKFNNRPKSRNRESIVKFLVEQIPKKENEQEQDTKESSKVDALNVQSFAEYLNSGYENEVREIQNILQESELLSQIAYHPSEQSNIVSRHGEMGGQTYIENYPKPLLEKAIFKMRFLEARRELEIFLHRSTLLKTPFLVQKFRKVEKNQLNNMFYNLVLLEQEYKSHHKSPISEFLNLSNSNRLTPLAALEFLRYIDQPHKQPLFLHVLKNSSKDLLKPMWNVIFNALDHFDLISLELILRYFTNLKQNFKIDISDNDAQALESISNAVTRIILDNRENYSLAALCSIISNLKQSKHILSNTTEKNIPIAQEQIIDKYKQEYLGKDKSHLKLSNREVFEILMGLLHLDNTKPGFEECLGDFYEKVKEKGLRYFDKTHIFRILIALSNNRIPLAEKLAQEIVNNTKVLDNLSLLDIYLLFYNFTESKQRLNPIYMKLFHAFFSSIEDKFALTDPKTIMLVSRITNFILENYIGEHRRQILEKKLLEILNLLEKSVDVVGDKLNPIEIVEISSVFINHLNVPNFMFKQINKSLDSLKITHENRPKVQKFITKYLQKIQPKFTFNVFTVFNQSELNDKITPEALILFRRLINKFRETNLFSYLNLNIQIMNNKHFFSLIFPSQDQQKKFIDGIVKQLLGLANNLETISFSNAVNIIRFLATYKDSIASNLNIALHQKFLNLFLIHYKNLPEEPYNTFLPWLYYQAQSIVHIRDDNLNTINNKQQSLLVNKLKKFITDNIIPNFCENSKVAVQQIIYDENIVQFFNSNVFNSNFYNLEYLLPLIDTLDIKRTAVLINNITLQLPRCVKRWEGELLLENLLLMEKFEIDCPDFFSLSSQNIFSFFVFFTDSQQLVLNPALINDEIIIRLLRAYINQKNKKYEKVRSDGETRSDMKIHSNSLVAVCALASRVFSKLTRDEVLDVARMLGNSRNNYTQGFIKQFSELEITQDPRVAFEVYSFLPEFLISKNLQRIVNENINQSITKLDPLNVFKVMSKNSVWIEEPIRPLLKNLFENKTVMQDAKELFKFLAVKGQNQSQNYLRDILAKIKQSKVTDFSEHVLMHVLAINASHNITIELQNKQKSTSDTNNKTAKKLVKDDALSKEFEPTVRKIAEHLLKSEFFSYFENVVVVNGETYKIPYYESLFYSEENKTIPYKIYPRNQSTLGQLHDTWTSLELLNNNDQFNLNTTGQILEQNVFEPPRQTVDYEIHEEYRGAALKYLLYHYYKQFVAGISDQNESLTEKFLPVQSKIYNLVKFSENYANFLIDMTLVLHEMDLLYKTNFVCDRTNILIDIAVLEKRIAIIFVEDKSTVKIASGTGRGYTLKPNNIQLLKGNVLEEEGEWNVVYIVENEWAAPGRLKEANEDFVRQQFALYQ